MTSPSRKKRRTTLRSTPAREVNGGECRPAENEGRSIDVLVGGSLPLVPVRREPVWLPAGFLAVLFLLTLTADSFGGDTALQWRSASSKSSRHVTHRAVHESDHRAVKRGRVSAGRIIDPGVQTVAYEDFGGSPAPPEPIQVAQGGGETDFGEELLRQFEEPLVEEEPIAPPPLEEEPGFEPLPPQRPELPIEEPPVLEERTPEEPKFDPFDDSDDEPEVMPRKPGRMESGEDAAKRKERMQAAQDCAEALATLRASNLTMVDITIGHTGTEGEDYPYICSIDDGIPLTPRCWSPITYTWKASALCHKPLYFEQEQVERYGHSWGPVLQPVMSGAHFFSRLPALPYMMGLKAPNECVYALGHYRPGNCAPYLIPAVPFTWRAALFEAGAWTGGVFAIP